MKRPPCVCDDHPGQRCDETGCDRVKPGAPWDASQCRVCWLWFNSASVRAAWSEGETTTMPAGNNTVEELAKAGVTVISLKPPPPTGPVEQAPGWFKKAANFAGALVKHAWAGLPQTPSEEQERRLAICLACEFLDQENGVCKKCGCGVVAKSGWHEQHCPIGKW